MNFNGNIAAANEQFNSWSNEFSPQQQPDFAWMYMGTIPAAQPGYVVDRYQNFISGAQENRNLRIGEVK